MATTPFSRSVKRKTQNVITATMISYVLRFTFLGRRTQNPLYQYSEREQRVFAHAPRMVYNSRGVAEQEDTRR
jgi:hypothetical protein